MQHQRRKYTETPAGIVAKVRPRRTIVRGGSRVTRGKCSVFLKRYATSLFIDFVSKTTIFFDGASVSAVPVPIFASQLLLIIRRCFTNLQGYHETAFPIVSCEQ